MKRRPKPLAGCGPYLMFEPEKESKMSVTVGACLNGAGAQIAKDVEGDQESRAAWAAARKACAAFEAGEIPFEEWRETSGIAKHLDVAALERASSQQRRAAEAQKQKQQRAWAFPGIPPMGPSESYMYGVGPISPQGPRNWFPVLSPSEAYVKGLEQQVLEGLGRIKLLETKIVAAESSGSHDYVGPTAPDGSGRQVSIPDAAHENFHKAVGDVLAGKIMQGARRQMQEALKGISKDPAPFPTSADHSDPRRIGWRVPS